MANNCCFYLVACLALYTYPVVSQNDLNDPYGQNAQAFWQQAQQQRPQDLINQQFSRPVYNFQESQLQAQQQQQQQRLQQQQLLLQQQRLQQQQQLQQQQRLQPLQNPNQNPTMFQRGQNYSK